jgi:transcriptional regulator with XRE-family HTH domain
VVVEEVVTFLRAARVRHGLTLRQLARCTGVNIALLSQAERGLTVLTRPAALRLAAFLELDPCELQKAVATSDVREGVPC